MIWVVFLLGHVWGVFYEGAGNSDLAHEECIEARYLLESQFQSPAYCVAYVKPKMCPCTQEQPR